MKLDLHTHTHRSGDSTTTLDEYVIGLDASGIDVVAVTDHLTIAGALLLADLLGPRVIVGQELRVREGELIGLFLSERIPPGLRAVEAAVLIRDQGGLVYVPHPGDTGRSSIKDNDLWELASAGVIDIIEVANSKIAPNGLIPIASQVCARLGIAVGAGSDAHIETAIGSTYLEVPPGKVASSTELLAALAHGKVHAQYFDPPRGWRARIVPAS